MPAVAPERHKDIGMHEEARRRVVETVVALRKARRDDQLMKRRNVETAFEEEEEIPVEQMEELKGKHAREVHALEIEVGCMVAALSKANKKLYKLEKATRLQEQHRSLKDETDELWTNAADVTKYETQIENMKKRLEDLSDVKLQLSLMEEKNATYMKAAIDLEEEQRKNSAIKAQLDAYKAQLLEVQSKLADEIKRGDAAEFTAKRAEEKLQLGVKEQERLRAEAGEVREMYDELQLEQFHRRSSQGSSGEEANMTTSTILMTSSPEIREKVMRLEHENKMLKMQAETQSSESTELLQGTITSSSPMAEHLGGLFASTPSHRRACSPHWSYQFCPAEPWIDLTISRSYAIQLNELIINESPSTADVLAVRGAVVYGAPGCGKTAVAYKLASRSQLFQPASSAPGVATLRPDPALSSDSGFITSSRLSMSQPSPDSSSGSSLLDFVASRVVAFHFCQVDSENTCSLPGFLRSLIASLIAAPQLRFYGEYLAKHRDLCDLLDSETALLSDPLDVFRRVLVERPKSLRKRNKIPARQPNLVILLDGIADAEYHRSESGYSILTFVTRHFKELPVWLRCIVTVRSSALDHLRGMSLHKVGLENLVVDERLYRDVEEYIAYRIRHSPSILANISPHGAEQPLDPGSLARFVDHLASLSKGNFLYLKLTLNLIERSHLIVKSTSYKVLPISLCEVFLLLFNLKFPIISVFERVTAILNTCLASLRPLKARELFDVVRHTHSDVELGWEEFCDRLLTLSEFVVQRSDDTFVLFHPAFREWLIRREETDSSKFLCNQRYGHFLIPQSTALQSAGLSSVELLELGHHILKAHIYKSLSKEMRNAVSPRDAQAYWVAIAAENVRTALLSAKNIFSPNTKVSRLLLLAGADPELPTELFNQAPLLGVAARLGHTEMVALLLEFGADPCCTGWDGCAPLMQAALMGHIDVVQLLHQHGAKLSQIDGEDCCALVYAARSGHVTLCSFLLQCDWSREVLGGEMTSSNESGAELGQMGALKRTAQQQAFVAAASKGQTQVCKFFLEFGEVSLDESDAVSGETALSVACLHGHKDTVQFLLSQGGAISYTNTDESATPPLISAVCGGCWEIVSTLLARGLDVDAERSPVSNSTPLMLAAAHGHIGLVELLLSRDAAVNAMDLDGRTALAHACLQGQQPSATLLLDRGTQIDASDNQGRTPLHHAASGGGDRHLISLLLDRGAPLERPDSLAHRPLEVAIAMNNVDAVVLFLRRGAKLSAAPMPGLLPLEAPEGEEILQMVPPQVCEDVSKPPPGAVGVFSLQFDIANAGLPALLRPVIDFIKQYSRPMPPIITTGLITVSICTLVDCVYSLHVFYELGGYQLLVDCVVTTAHRELPTSSRDCSSMLKQSAVLSCLVRSASSTSSSKDRKTPQSATAALWEMYKDYGTITSSSPMAEHLGGLFASTPSHRRACSPHWSYQFCPAEPWIDLTISRSYVIQLNEPSSSSSLSADPEISTRAPSTLSYTVLSPPANVVSRPPPAPQLPHNVPPPPPPTGAASLETANSPEQIQQSSTFYERLLSDVQTYWCFSTDDLVRHILRPGGQTGAIDWVAALRGTDVQNNKAKRQALDIAQGCCLALGDLARYQRQLDGQNQQFGKAEAWYLKAMQLNQKNGHPYNQLALLAWHTRDRIECVYFYVRAVAAPHPFDTAAQSLLQAFEEVHQRFTCSRLLTDTSTDELSKRLHIYFLVIARTFYTRNGLENLHVHVENTLLMLRSLLQRSPTGPLTPMILILHKMITIAIFCVHVNNERMSVPLNGSATSPVQMQAVSFLLAFVGVLLEPVAQLSGPEMSTQIRLVLPALRTFSLWMQYAFDQLPNLELFASTTYYSINTWALLVESVNRVTQICQHGQMALYATVHDHKNAVGSLDTPAGFRDIVLPEDIANRGFTNAFSGTVPQFYRLPEKDNEALALARGHIRLAELCRLAAELGLAEDHTCGGADGDPSQSTCKTCSNLNRSFVAANVPLTPVLEASGSMEESEEYSLRSNNRSRPPHNQARPTIDLPASRRMIIRSLPLDIRAKTPLRTRLSLKTSHRPGVGRALLQEQCDSDASIDAEPLPDGRPLPEGVPLQLSSLSPIKLAKAVSSPVKSVTENMQKRTLTKIPSLLDAWIPTPEWLGSSSGQGSMENFLPQQQEFIPVTKLLDPTHECDIEGCCSSRVSLAGSMCMENEENAGGRRYSRTDLVKIGHSYPIDEELQRRMEEYPLSCINRPYKYGRVDLLNLQTSEASELTPCVNADCKDLLVNSDDDEEGSRVFSGNWNGSKLAAELGLAEDHTCGGAAGDPSQSTCKTCSNLNRSFVAANVPLTPVLEASGSMEESEEYRQRLPSICSNSSGRHVPVTSLSTEAEETSLSPELLDVLQGRTDISRLPRNAREQLYRETERYMTARRRRWDAIFRCFPMT